MRTASGLSWLANDDQDSSQIVLPDSTGVEARALYTPYGQLRGATSSPTPQALLGTDRGYLGKTNDPSTSLDLLGARYYNPALAHFTSTDPLNSSASAVSADPYAYANSNPTSLSDPNGLAGCPPPGHGKARQCPGGNPDPGKPVVVPPPTGPGKPPPKWTPPVTVTVDLPKTTLTDGAGELTLSGSVDIASDESNWALTVSPDGATIELITDGGTVLSWDLARALKDLAASPETVIPRRGGGYTTIKGLETQVGESKVSLEVSAGSVGIEDTVEQNLPGGDGKVSGTITLTYSQKSDLGPLEKGGEAVGIIAVVPVIALLLVAGGDSGSDLPDVGPGRQAALTS